MSVSWGFKNTKHQSLFFLKYITCLFWCSLIKQEFGFLPGIWDPESIWNDFVILKLFVDYSYVTNFSLFAFLCLLISRCVCCVYVWVYAYCTVCLCCVLCFHDVIKAVLVTGCSRMPSSVWRRSVTMCPLCWWWAAPGWCCLAAPSVVQIPVPLRCSSLLGSSVPSPKRGSCQAA